MNTDNENIIINGDSNCICGSNKLFSECCMSKNHTYKSLGKNYKNKEVIYDHTEVTNALEKLQNYINLRISTEFNLTLTKEDALRKLRRLFEKLDKALGPIHKVSSCIQLCSYCCYGMVVSTTMLEYELIKEYMKDNFTSQQIYDFRSKIENSKSLFHNLIAANGVIAESEYTNSYHPCAFLSDDNKCTIYQVRPYMCRKYLVFSKPRDCSIRGGEDIHYFSPYFNVVDETLMKLNIMRNNRNLPPYKHLLAWFIGDLILD